MVWANSWGGQYLGSVEADNRWLRARVAELGRDLADAQEEIAQLRASDRVTYADYESANQTATKERKRAELVERALEAANTLARQDRERIERLEQENARLRKASGGA